MRPNWEGNYPCCCCCTIWSICGISLPAKTNSEAANTVTILLKYFIFETYEKKICPEWTTWIVNHMNHNTFSNYSSIHSRMYIWFADTLLSFIKVVGLPLCLHFCHLLSLAFIFFEIAPLMKKNPFGQYAGPSEF